MLGLHPYARDKWDIPTARSRKLRTVASHAAEQVSHAESHGAGKNRPVVYCIFYTRYIVKCRKVFDVKQAAYRKWQQASTLVRSKHCVYPLVSSFTSDFVSTCVIPLRSPEKTVHTKRFYYQQSQCFTFTHSVILRKNLLKFHLVGFRSCHFWP